MSKKFDCVKMKNDIQKKLLKEMKKFTKQEWVVLSKKKILRNPILAQILKNKAKKKPKL